MGPSMRYLVVRAALFVVPFALLMVAQVPWPLSLVIALAFAFAASIVFFPKLREEAAADLRRMRDGRRRDGVGPDDADVEDSVLDRSAAGGDGRREPAVDARTEGDPVVEAPSGTDPEIRPARDGDDPEASARP